MELCDHPVGLDFLKSLDLDSREKIDRYLKENQADFKGVINVKLLELFKQKFTKVSKEITISAQIDQNTELAFALAYPEFTANFSQSRKLGHGPAAASRVFEMELILKELHYYELGRSQNRFDDIICDIGGNWFDHMIKDRIGIHSCCPELSSYDQQRHADRKFRLGLLHKSGNRVLDQMRSGNIFSVYCRNKVQHCNRTAKMMIAIHSLYDIHLADLVQAMSDKRSVVCLATMMFTSDILYSTSGKISDLGAYFEISSYRRRKIITFGFENDMSYTYSHDLKHYLEYFTTNLVRDKNGVVYTVEKLTNRMGVTYLKILCTGSKNTFTSSLDNNVWFTHSEPMFIVKYFDLVPSKMHTNSIYFMVKEKSLVAPVILVNQILTYAYRIVDSANFTANYIFSFAASLNNTLIINGTDITVKTPMDTEDLYELSHALYIYAYVKRYEAGKVDQTVISHENLSRSLALQSTFERLASCSKIAFGRLVNYFRCGKFNDFLYYWAVKPHRFSIQLDKAVSYESFSSRLRSSRKKCGNDVLVIPDDPFLPVWKNFLHSIDDTDSKKFYYSPLESSKFNSGVPEIPTSSINYLEVKNFVAPYYIANYSKRSTSPHADAKIYKNIDGKLEEIEKIQIDLSVKLVNCHNEGYPTGYTSESVIDVLAQVLGRNADYIRVNLLHSPHNISGDDPTDMEVLDLLKLFSLHFFTSLRYHTDITQEIGNNANACIRKDSYGRFNVVTHENVRVLSVNDIKNIYTKWYMGGVETFYVVTTRKLKNLPPGIRIVPTVESIPFDNVVVLVDGDYSEIYTRFTKTVIFVSINNITNHRYSKMFVLPNIRNAVLLEYTSSSQPMNTSMFSNIISTHISDCVACKNVDPCADNVFFQPINVEKTLFSMCNLLPDLFIKKQSSNTVYIDHRSLGDCHHSNVEVVYNFNKLRYLNLKLTDIRKRFTGSPAYYVVDARYLRRSLGQKITTEEKVLADINHEDAISLMSVSSISNTEFDYHHKSNEQLVIPTAPKPTDSDRSEIGSIGESDCIYEYPNPISYSDSVNILPLEISDLNQLVPIIPTFVNASDLVSATSSIYILVFNRIEKIMYYPFDAELKQLIDGVYQPCVRSRIAPNPSTSHRDAVPGEITDLITVVANALNKGVDYIYPNIKHSPYTNGLSVDDYSLDLVQALSIHFSITLYIHTDSGVSVYGTKTGNKCCVFVRSGVVYDAVHNDFVLDLPFIETHGKYTIVDVPGDGDCLYHALALGVGEDSVKLKNVLLSSTYLKYFPGTIDIMTSEQMRGDSSVVQLFTYEFKTAVSIHNNYSTSIEEVITYGDYDKKFCIGYRNNHYVYIQHADQDDIVITEKMVDSIDTYRSPKFDKHNVVRLKKFFDTADVNSKEKLGKYSIYDSWYDSVKFLNILPKHLPPFPNDTPDNIAKNAAYEIRHAWRYSDLVIIQDLQNKWRTVSSYVNSDFRAQDKFKTLSLDVNDYGLYDTNLKKFLITPDDVQNYQVAYDGNRIVIVDNMRVTYPDKHGRYLLVNRNCVLLNNHMLYHSTKDLDIDSFTLPSYSNIQGVPGCGKTYHILTNHTPGKDLVLTTTREGAMDLRERVATMYPQSVGYLNSNYRTAHSYLINSKSKYNTVWIDEALMKHYGEIVMILIKSACKNFVLVGDKAQIPFINRTLSIKMEYIKPHDFLPVTQVKNISYRCTRDSAALLTNQYEGGFFTVNNNVHTIKTFRISSVSQVPNTADSVYLTFKQSEKHELLSRKYRLVNTIHEYQGKEADNVVIVRLNPKIKDPLYSSSEHQTVAITRHKKSLIYYTVVEDDLYRILSNRLSPTQLRTVFRGGYHVGEKYLSVPKTSLRHSLTVTKILDNHLLLDIECSRLMPKYPHPDYDIPVPVVNVDCAPDLATLQTWYDHLLPGNSVRDRVYEQYFMEYSDLDINLENTYIRLGARKPLKFEMPIIEPQLRTSISVNRKSSQRETIMALIKRNLNVPDLATNIDKDLFVNIMTTRFIETYIDPRNMDLFKTFKDNLIYPSSQLIKEWLLTQPAEVVQQFDTVLPIWDKRLRKYSLMNKKNPKPNLTTLAPYEYQALQTIAYHEKLVNAILCPIFREVKSRLIGVLKDKFLLFTDISPNDFADLLTKRFSPKILGKNYRKLEIDMSKYDKSQQELLFEFELAILSCFGVPDFFIELWRLCHVSTILNDYMNKVRSYVLFQRKSGDPSTFIGNTIVLMGIIAMLYNLHLVVLALFAGDDSLIITKEMLLDRNDMCAKLFNLESKFFKYNYPYFCSKFLLTDGLKFFFVPDPLKFVTKLGRHDLVNWDHVEEYRISCVDLLQPMLSETVIPHLNMAINERYPSNIIDHSGVLRALNGITSTKEKFHSIFHCPDPSRLRLDPKRPSLDI